MSGYTGLLQANFMIFRQNSAFLEKYTKFVGCGEHQIMHQSYGNLEKNTGASQCLFYLEACMSAIVRHVFCEEPVTRVYLFEKPKKNAQTQI